MSPIRVEARLERDGVLVLDDLPFRAGDSVEVTIFARPHHDDSADRYPLRGLPITYLDPTETVAEDDWEACR